MNERNVIGKWKRKTRIVQGHAQGQSHLPGDTDGEGNKSQFYVSFYSSPSQCMVIILIKFNNHNLVNRSRSNSRTRSPAPRQRSPPPRQRSPPSRTRSPPHRARLSPSRGRSSPARGRRSSPPRRLVDY